MSSCCPAPCSVPEINPLGKTVHSRFSSRTFQRRDGKGAVRESTLFIFISPKAFSLVLGIG